MDPVGPDPDPQQIRISVERISFLFVRRLYCTKYQYQAEDVILGKRKLGAATFTVNSATNALQNGACTYRCISKQMY